MIDKNKIQTLMETTYMVSGDHGCGELHQLKNGWFTFKGKEVGEIDKLSEAIAIELADPIYEIKLTPFSKICKHENSIVIHNSDKPCELHDAEQRIRELESDYAVLQEKYEKAIAGAPGSV